MSRPALCESARLATLAADEEKASLPGGAFSVEAPALGETNRAARRSCCGLVGNFWARVSERPESSGWLAGPQLVDDDEPITLCPASAGLFLRTLPAPPGLRAGERSERPTMRDAFRGTKTRTVYYSAQSGSRLSCFVLGKRRRKLDDIGRL